MQSLQAAVRTAGLVFGVILLLVATLDAVPSPSIQPNYYSDSLTNDESQRLGILEMLAQLGQNMIRDDLENSKRLRRTVADFGLGRGFSGKLEAEHRLGYDRAMDPQGPGRKRSGDIYLSKRGLGFGMDRGFSGQQAARHLMGLHVATWPGGPGRRRRSDADDFKRGMGFGMDRAISGGRTASYMLGNDAANRIGKRSDISASSGEPEE